MRKILRLCVSVLLSLSFLIPLGFIKLIDVHADSSTLCESYDSYSDGKKARLNSVLGYSTINFVFEDSAGWLFYARDVTFSGTVSAAKPSAAFVAYIAPDGSFTDYTNMQQYLTFDFTTGKVFKFIYKSGLRVHDDFTFSNSACVVNTYLITAYAGSGGTVTGGGTYTAKQTVTLNAIPDQGYRFKQWSDGNTENPRSFVPSSDLTLTAEFEEIPYYNLNLDYIGIGQVIGTGRFEGGSEVTIEALPGTHYYFEMWSDGNTENPRTLVLNENLHLTAVFFEDPKYQVNVEIFGNGSVTGIGTYYGDTEVMLTAVPDEGWYFKSWNDGSIDPAKVITVSRDITFAAVFEEKSTRACSYSKDLVANPYVLKGVERAIYLVESNVTEDYWWIAKRFHNFSLNLDGGYVPSGTAFVQPQSIEWVLAYYDDDKLVYESLGFENNVPGYYSFIHTDQDGNPRYHTLELIVGNNPGYEYVDTAGVSTSFELVSRYDQIEILDSYCWKEGYDSNYYDLLQFYELKNANSNLSNNTNELKDMNTNLSLIERGISGITGIIESVPAKLTIIAEHVYSVFEKLDHVISGLFDVESAVNDLIDSNDQQSQLIDGGTQVSQSVSNKNDSVTSELFDSISQHNHIEQEYQAQMNQAMSNIDFNIDVGNVANFSTTAAFISGQMDLMFNLDPAFKLMFTFPLICGLAMLIIGRLKS